MPGPAEFAFFEKGLDEDDIFFLTILMSSDAIWRKPTMLTNALHCTSSDWNVHVHFEAANGIPPPDSVTI